jgi:hypothetical protein
MAAEPGTRSRRSRQFTATRACGVTEIAGHPRGQALDSGPREVLLESRHARTAAWVDRALRRGDVRYRFVLDLSDLG